MGVTVGVTDDRLEEGVTGVTEGSRDGGNAQATGVTEKVTGVTAEGGHARPPAYEAGAAPPEVTEALANPEFLAALLGADEAQP